MINENVKNILKTKGYDEFIEIDNSIKEVTKDIDHVDHFILVKKNNLFGICDLEGNEIFPCIVSNKCNIFRIDLNVSKKDPLLAIAICYEFINGEKVYGALNSYGKTIIPFNYSFINKCNYEIFTVKGLNNLSGYIDIYGNILAEPIFDLCLDFQNEKYARILHSSGKAKNRKENIIDNTGKILFDFVFDKIYPVKDDKFIVTKDEVSYGVIDANGNTVVELIYEDVCFNDKLMVGSLIGEFGIIDFDDNVIVDFKYDSILPVISDNLNIVQVDYKNKVGFIELNTKDKKFTEFKYELRNSDNESLYFTKYKDEYLVYYYHKLKDEAYYTLDLISNIDLDSLDKEAIIDEELLIMLKNIKNRVSGGNNNEQ